MYLTLLLSVSASMRPEALRCFICQVRACEVISTVEASSQWGVGCASRRARRISLAVPLLMADMTSTSSWLYLPALMYLLYLLSLYDAREACFGEECQVVLGHAHGEPQAAADAPEVDPGFVRDVVEDGEAGRGVDEDRGTRQTRPESEGRSVYGCPADADARHHLRRVLVVLEHRAEYRYGEHHQNDERGLRPYPPQPLHGGKWGVYPINHIGKGLYYIVKECTTKNIQCRFVILPRNK